MNNAFELKDVTKIYKYKRLFPFSKKTGHFVAVNNVSFKAERGEIVALIGESGCGKTTIANMLLLLLRVDSGEIFIDGEDVTSIRGYKNLAPIRRKIQAVFQNGSSSLDPVMTLEKIITEPLKNYRMPCKGEAERLMELVGIPGEWKKRFPSQLSGGQRQRISIARAMALNPSTLILDEPTSNLDVVTTNNIIRLLKELNKKQNTSMLFITHDIALADRFCDSKYIMKNGKIIERLKSLDKSAISDLYTLNLVKSQLKFTHEEK